MVNSVWCLCLCYVECFAIHLDIITGECSRTSVLVSIVFHEHSHPRVNHVYVYVPFALILMYACSYCILACIMLL